MIFFFFQAEDGIRDLIVTGVQTCALPISPEAGLQLDGGTSTADATLRGLGGAAGGHGGVLGGGREGGGGGKRGGFGGGRVIKKKKKTCCSAARSARRGVHTI